MYFLCGKLIFKYPSKIVNVKSKKKEDDIYAVPSPIFKKTLALKFVWN